MYFFFDRVVGLVIVLFEWMDGDVGFVRVCRVFCLFDFVLFKFVFNVYFVGGRDKRGGFILIFLVRSNYDRIRQEDLRRFIFYLVCIFR